jgi:anti-sigma factor RsiW
MKCNDKKIKELLPLYLERELEGAQLTQVERHLASCEDCRTEFSLLRMVSEEPVPDPGEAFWATMPERVAQDVRRRKQAKVPGLSAMLGALFTYRWAWATASVCILTVALWSVRPAPVNMTGFPERDIEVAIQSQNELEPYRDALDMEVSDRNQQISDDILKLNERQLDRFYELLDKKEQDIQEKIRKKMKNQKNIG